MRTDKDKEEDEIAEIERLIALLFGQGPLTDEHKAEIARMLQDDECQSKIAESISGSFRTPRNEAEDREFGDRLYKRIKSEQGHLFSAPLPRRRPLHRRMLFRTAAIVLPFLALIGTAWYLFDRAVPSSAEPIMLLAKTALPVVESVDPEPDEPVAVEEEVIPVVVSEQVTYDVVVSAPKGKQRYIRLPDRTTVILQGGSRLLYSSAGRESYLEGEAYFEVEKGHRQPFRVQTGELTVNVTGTRFNVQAWANSEQQLVDLIDGSVDVQMDDRKIHLEPMEELAYQCNNRQLKLTAFDGNGWWNEPISFTEVTLIHILEEIENYYDIRILGKETISDTALYTIKFDRVSTVEQMLDIMHELLEYRKDANGITVNRRETDNR